MAVAGGAGWLESHGRAHRPEESSPDAHRAAEARTAVVRDPGWGEVITHLVEEPGLVELVEYLAGAGAPVPEAGFELGDAAWPAPADRSGQAGDDDSSDDSDGGYGGGPDR